MGLRRLIDEVMAELVGPRGSETCSASSATSTLSEMRASPANSIMCPQADTPSLHDEAGYKTAAHTTLSAPRKSLAKRGASI